MTTKLTSIRRASLDDAPALATIFVESFRQARFWDWTHEPPRNATEAQKQQLIDEVIEHRTTLIRRQICKENADVQLALYDGKPAGFAMWSVEEGTSNTGKRISLRHRLHGLNLQEQGWGIWYKLVDKFVYSWLPNSIKSWLWYPTLGKRYFERLAVLHSQHDEENRKFIRIEDKERGYRMLHFLGVHPSYERKGLGGLLLRPGCQQAKEDGTSIYLGATAVGKPLYERHGFEELGSQVLGEESTYSWLDTAMRFNPDFGSKGKSV